MLTSRDYVKSMLLDIAWFEASSLGAVTPMQMVAQCLANRVRLGWGSWSEVFSRIYTPGPHAMTRTRILDRLMVRQSPNIADPRFTQMLAHVDRIYDNTAEDLAKGGTYWADLQQVVFDRRFEKSIMQNPTEHPRTSQQGTFCCFG